MEVDVLEGFLCPICLRDLKSPTNLANHFEESHADEKDVVGQLRSILGKAKRKILKQDENLNTATTVTDADLSLAPGPSKGTPWSGGIDLNKWDVQSLGATRNHMKDFYEERKVKIERTVVETNKLVIRLDKLIKSGVYSTDSSVAGALKARKGVERRIVPWENDQDVKFCPVCAKKFSITYRRHHCRLCGKVICEKCSAVVSVPKACEILKLSSQSLVPKQLDPGGSGGSQADDTGLLACQVCIDLLERHAQMSKDKAPSVAIVELYQKMLASMSEADALQPTFLKMANSVNAGETEFGIEAALATRLKLLKSYELVESISKKISLLGTDKSAQPHPHVLRLQRAVRAFASGYLADNMFTLPALPSKEKFEALVKEKLKDRERRKAEKAASERAVASSNSLKRQNAPTPNVPDTTDGRPGGVPGSRTRSLGPASAQELSYDSDTSIGANGLVRVSSSKLMPWKKDVKLDVSAVSISKSTRDGWGPLNVLSSPNDDPMAQQIDIIKGYMRQARQEKKWDEYRMFEENLKELELFRSQQSNSQDLR